MSFDPDFSISSVFDRVLPAACPAAASSRIVVSPHSGTKVTILDDAGAVHPDGGLNWTLDRLLTGKDIKLRVVGKAGTPRPEVFSTQNQRLTSITYSPYCSEGNFGRPHPVGLDALELGILHQNNERRRDDSTRGLYRRIAMVD